jgi:beta-xylosidase
MFVNPVLDRDFPDPDILAVGDGLYAFATNGRSQSGRWQNVQVAISRDLVTWEERGDALPVLPSWAGQDGGSVWAPDVSARQDGHGYVLYFTARDRRHDRQCIGVATSAMPDGPYTPQDVDPLVWQVDEGGSIDHATFLDEDGSAFLLWKSEGPRGFLGRGAAWIYMQSISSDGLALVGEPSKLIRADRDWEGARGSARAVRCAWVERSAQRAALGRGPSPPRSVVVMPSSWQAHPFTGIACQANRPIRPCSVSIHGKSRGLSTPSTNAK